VSIVKIPLPPGVTAIGALHNTENADALDQDMLQLTLPGAVFIDVGWYPDCDPGGEYRVVVFRDDFESPLEEAFHAKEVAAVVDKIQRLLAKYAPTSSPAAGEEASIQRRRTAG